MKYLNTSVYRLIRRNIHNYEIILVDDASTDNSVPYLINLVRKFKNVKLIRNNNNQGILNARVNGVLHSQGVYIMHFDPDDDLYYHNFETVLRHAFEINADVIEYRSKYIMDNGTIINLNIKRCKRNFEDQPTLLESLLEKKIWFTIWKKFIKRSIYAKAVPLLIPFIEKKKIIFAEDKLATVFLYMFAQNLTCTKRLLYIYKQHLDDNSLSGKYQTSYQTHVQSRYVSLFFKYLLLKSNRSQFSFEEFMKYPGVENVYNNLTDIVKKDPSFDCERDLPTGLSGTRDDSRSICVIQRLD